MTMKIQAELLKISLAMLMMAAVAATTGCGGGGSTSTTTTTTQAAAPTLATKAAQNNAVIVTMSTTSSGASVYYTIDGTTPTTSSSLYVAPFLVSQDMTINAIAGGSSYTNSTATTKALSLGVTSGALAWSDEFANSTGANAQPDSTVWAYDTGNGTSGWGNNELEYYCSYNSSTSPCVSSTPNAYVGTDGYLHIKALNPSTGVYTSARMKSQGLFGFQYGRLEVRAKAPEGKGLWPAIWMLGADYATTGWPGCGELDLLERVNAATSPDWNTSSIHGTGVTGSNLGTTYNFASGDSAANWHTYGMIWKKDSVQYYIDTPSTPFASFTPASISGFSGSVWPFNSRSNFLILNVAVGGSWPGSPDSTTTFPAEMLVDYVRIYAN